MPSLTLLPDHSLFLDIAFQDVEKIEVHLGANPACARALPGLGVPCVLYPYLSDGRIGGSGRHAGFVVEFPIDELVEAGFSEDDCWLALGCHHATHQDETGPVCEECLSAGGGKAKRFKGEAVCWSCKEMWQETLNERLHNLECMF